MFYRDFISELEAWADSYDRRPLVIRGARQVGKTTVVEIFSRQFDQYIYLNLEKAEDREVFTKHDNLEKIIQTIFIKNKKVRKDRKTLIFIDEIQEVPKAIQQLRYFYEDAKDLYVIAAGSLLKAIMSKKYYSDYLTNKEQTISFPVGRVDFKLLRPVSFIEFLKATENDLALEELQKIPVDPGAHLYLQKLFHTYALIGGMPKVVDAYIKTGDVSAISGVYDNLLYTYISDIQKYARNPSMAQVLDFVIRSVFNEAGNRITFRGFGNSEYRSREISDALKTLEDTWLIQLVYPTTNKLLPIWPDYKKSPRLQIVDTGLVNYFAGVQTDLINSDDIGSSHKGKIAEHIVGQELLSNKHLISSKLVFWVREKRGSQAELDYLYNYRGKLIPIEVKSGAKGKLKSLLLFMEETHHKVAVRFYAGEFSIDKIKTNNGKEFTLYNLPYYLVSQLDDYLAWILGIRKEAPTRYAIKNSYDPNIREPEGEFIISSSKKNKVRNELFLFEPDRERISKILQEAIKVKLQEKAVQRFINILKIVSENPGLHSKEIAKKAGVSEVTIRRDVQKLKGIVTFIGSPKTGGYYATEKALDILNKI